MQKQLQSELTRLLAKYNDRACIVHSDLFFAAKFIETARNRSELLARHVNLLESLGLRLKIPAFNYQFPKTRTIDLRTAPIELGPLNQYMLNEWATDRSADPIFSFLSRGPLVETGSDWLSFPFVAFGHHTEFSNTVKENGAMLLYGAPISTITMIHHAEISAGGPVYRYDKSLDGQLTTWQGERVNFEYVYHVRPMGRELEYDWPTIERLLVKNGIAKPVRAGKFHFGYVISASGFVECLVDKIKEDPLSLLTKGTRSWVGPMLERLGRRFEIADFESET